MKREYDSFIKGIEEAIKLEELKIKIGEKKGPFANLLNYKPSSLDTGFFPPLQMWRVDMQRVLYGLDGEIGDAMRESDLSVYDGVPFSTGLSGRKKIAKEKINKPKKAEDIIVAEYWRDKIRAESRQIFDGKWGPMRFVFTEKELDYHIKMLKRNS